MKLEKVTIETEFNWIIGFSVGYNPRYAELAIVVPFCIILIDFDPI